MLPTPALFTALTLDILLQKPKESKDGRKKVLKPVHIRTCISLKPLLACHSMA